MTAPIPALNEASRGLSNTEALALAWRVLGYLSGRVDAADMDAAVRAAVEVGAQPSAENDVLQWRHCRWFDPHPPTPKPDSYVAVVRSTGAPGAECSTCGEALTARVIRPQPAPGAPS